MMTGKVVGIREAVVRLVIFGESNQQREFEAILDTGYTGFLTLPAEMIADLELDWRRRQQTRLADGSKIFSDVYEATVLWDGKPRRIFVDEVNSESLLGMSMLAHHELSMKIFDGGEVLISKLP
ncbi:MAG: clan AA aspartic protease [Blastocatellia bacterium]